MEAIEQQVVVKARSPGAFRGWNRPGPKTESAFRVAAPAVAAVVLAEKLAALVKQNTVKSLARPKLSTGHVAAASIGLDLVFRHAAFLRAWRQVFNLLILRQV